MEDIIILCDGFVDKVFDKSENEEAEKYYKNCQKKYEGSWEKVHGRINLRHYLRAVCIQP